MKQDCTWSQDILKKNGIEEKKDGLCTEIEAEDLKRWLKKSKEIPWNYKNIVKRQG